MKQKIYIIHSVDTEDNFEDDLVVYDQITAYEQAYQKAVLGYDVKVIIEEEEI